ncbi:MULTISPECIES: gamma-glutamyl-gamma-aminobutyrate hydrolase family protein [unclassified Roseateles]|uniref:gamma-glutamyl-gamma-aminobutyrate hydrolase family protein n=1 Tax=unclassified Roseateles TaxID=2626991 RepID=UPI0009E6EA20|nr:MULTISPECIES: type 1 glutamine amidotransferase [unclassified Roseateles]
MHTPDKLRPLLIGVSARIYYPATPVLDLGGVWTRTLHYLEQSAAVWLARSGALPVMVPGVDSRSLALIGADQIDRYAQALDGLVLQGGNDVCPATYGEEALRPEWAGDAIRDHYELNLIDAFVQAGKPVFGICRGMQLLNVAFGGTLYQDLPTQRPQTGETHFARQAYEQNFHHVDMVPGGWLAHLYPNARHCRVNSIHHQGVKDLAPAFRVEARCPDDDIVEAIRSTRHPFVAGVQWHPEFHGIGEPTVFDDSKLLADFLLACRRASEVTEPVTVERVMRLPSHGGKHGFRPS